MFTVLASTAPQAAPVIHWKCDEASGNLLSDATGNGVEGTWAGTGAAPGWQPVGGVDGGAVSFSGLTGANDFFTAPVTTPASDPVSISVWFKTVSTQNDGLVFLGNGAASDVYKTLRIETNLGRLGIRATGNETKLAGTATLNDNTWHHLTGVFESTSSRKLYIDGVLVASNTAVIGNIPMNRLGIGALTRSNTADLYTGLLDEVAVWGEALTARQVAALHALGAARAGNASDLEAFLTAFSGAAPVTTGGRSWAFATGLSGGLGTISGSLTGGDLAVVLDADAGTGMQITNGLALPVIASFTAEPASITSGETSTLSWSITNAVTARIDPGNITVNATAGTLSVMPGVSRTYTLTAVNGTGQADRSAVVSVEVPRRLQFHWALDEGTGTAAGSSTGQFSGQLTGMPLPQWISSGILGSAVDFSTSFPGTVRTPAQVIEGYPFSLGAWVRTTFAGTEVLATLGTGVDDQYHALQIFNGAARLTARNGTLTFNLNGPVENDGNWHFITGVFTSRQVRTLFVDGVQAATVNDDSHGILPADRFVIGALETSDATILNPFTGVMDDASFWRGVLSAPDIAALHGAAVGLGLNAGAVSRLMLAYEAVQPVEIDGYTWSPTQGLAGPAGQTTGSLAGGDAVLFLDNAGGGMEVTAVPADFRIASVLFNPANRSVTITWPSEAGRNFRVEVSTGPGAWSPLVLSVPGEAGQTSYTESAIPAAETRRFYRVRQLPL